MLGLLACFVIGDVEASTLLAEPAPTPPVFIGTQAGGNVGILVSGFDYHVGLAADAFAVTSAGGRYRINGTRSFADHLYFAGEVAASVGLGNAALAGVSLTSQVGLAFAWWRVALGAYVNVVPTRAGQVLPSLSAAFRPSFWGISAAVLERPIAPVARLGVELWDLTLSYAFPVGGDIAYQPQLFGDVALDAHAFGYQLFNSFQSGVTIGLLWRRRPQ